MILCMVFGCWLSIATVRSGRRSPRQKGWLLVVLVVIDQGGIRMILGEALLVMPALFLGIGQRLAGQFFNLGISRHIGKIDHRYVQMVNHLQVVRSLTW